MGGGGVCAGELRGKAWVGRGRGECRFVPALGSPVEPPPPPPQGAFLRLFLPFSSYVSLCCKPFWVFLQIYFALRRKSAL